MVDELNCVQGGWLDVWGGFHSRQLSSQGPFVPNTSYFSYVQSRFSSLKVKIGFFFSEFPCLDAHSMSSILTKRTCLV